MENYRDIYWQVKERGRQQVLHAIMSSEVDFGMKAKQLRHIGMCLQQLLESDTITAELPETATGTSLDNVA